MNNKTLNWIPAAFLLMLLPADAGAANFFVRDVEQFEKYIERLAPGDTVFLKSGDEWKDVNLVFEGEGEPERPIVLTARRKGQTVFTGQSRLRILGKHLVVDGLVFRDGSLSGGSVISIGSRRAESAQGCRLTNTVITDYNPPDRKVNYKWVSVYGKRNRVDHCYFKGQDHTGQSVVVWLNGEPNDHRIDHNYFAGRPVLGWNGGETLRVGTSARSMEDSRTVIEDNLFENCDGEVESISIKSCENIVRRNAFVGSSGTVTLRHGNRNRVEGNWFIGNGKKRTGGVRIIGEDHVVVNNHMEGLLGRGGRSAVSIMNGVPKSPLNGYWPVKGALVAHNTIVDCVSLFDIGFGAGGRGRTISPSGVRIVANLVRAVGDSAVVIRAKGDVTWSWNVWADGSEPIRDGFERRDVAFSKGALFSSPGDFETLAIPTVEHTVTHDINGHIRTTGVVGCDVFSDSPIRSMPPARRTVGPDWME